MSTLYEIDPYDDVEISKNDLSKIVQICNDILDASLLQNYGESAKGSQMLRDLIEITQKAMLRGLGLVSKGRRTGIAFRNWV